MPQTTINPNPISIGIDTLKDILVGRERQLGIAAPPTNVLRGHWDINKMQTAIQVGVGEQVGSFFDNYPGDTQLGMISVPGTGTMNGRFENMEMYLAMQFGPVRATVTSSLVNTTPFPGPSFVYEGVANPNGTNPSITAHAGPPAGSFTGAVVNPTQYKFWATARLTNGPCGFDVLTDAGPPILVTANSNITNGQVSLNIMRWPNAQSYDVAMSQSVYANGAYQPWTIPGYLGTVADPGGSVGYVNFTALTPSVNPAVIDPDNAQAFVDYPPGSYASMKANVFVGDLSGLTSPITTGAVGNRIPNSNNGFVFDDTSLLGDGSGSTVPTRLIITIAGLFTADPGTHSYGDPNASYANGAVTNVGGITVVGLDTNGTDAVFSFNFNDTNTNNATASFQQVSGTSSTGYPLRSIPVADSGGGTKYGIFLNGEADENWTWTGTPTITLQAESTAGRKPFIQSDRIPDLPSATIYNGDNTQFWQTPFGYVKDLDFKSTLDKGLAVAVSTGGQDRIPTVEPGVVAQGQTTATYPVVAKYNSTAVINNKARLFVDTRALNGSDNYGTTQYQGIFIDNDWKWDNQRDDNGYLDDRNVLENVSQGPVKPTISFTFQWNGLAFQEYLKWNSNTPRYFRVQYRGVTMTLGTAYPHYPQVTMQQKLLMDVAGTYTDYKEGTRKNNLTRVIKVAPFVDPLFNAYTRVILINGSTLGG